MEVVLLSSFQSGLLFFFFFLTSLTCLIASARTPAIMLNTVVRVMKPTCIDRDLGGIYFQFKYVVSFGFFTDVLYRIEISFSLLVECSYHEIVLDFAKCFFCICWDDHVVFVFESIGKLNDFHTLNQPCIPGVNLTFSWFIIIFVYF